MIESEKYLEKKLDRDVKSLGGWTIKLLPFLVTGLPDRLCLFAEGRIAFAEIKTTEKEPTKRQLSIHKKLKGLGFVVVVLDTSKGINEFLQNYQK